MMIVVGDPNEENWFSADLNSATTRNRLKSHTGSPDRPSGQHRDLIYGDQVSGKDLTSLKSIAADIGSGTPHKLFVNSEAEQGMENDWQNFQG
jgi:hypothetical protein